VAEVANTHFPQESDMDTQTKLLETVLKWGKNRGLDEFEIATAQSLAWYYATKFKGKLPDSHWARVAVRAVWNGRDLPGCGTSSQDALNFTWQGAGMQEVTDQTPGPDVLAAHKEALERVLSELTAIKKEVADLRLAGMATKEIAIHLHVSKSRVSQIAREIGEMFKE